MVIKMLTELEKRMDEQRDLQQREKYKKVLNEVTELKNIII